MITTRLRSQTLAFSPNSRLNIPMVPGPQISWVMSTSALTHTLSPACTEALPAARATDLAVCVGPPDVIVMASFTVLIGSLPAARLGDSTAHGGVIVMGMPTVLVGG